MSIAFLGVFGNNLLSSQLQFGFKPGISTTMCTGILKATVSRYLCGGSAVYGCLIDASKAFDTVDHTLLLEKLIARDLPIGDLYFHGTNLNRSGFAGKLHYLSHSQAHEECSHLYCSLCSYIDDFIDGAC